MTSPQRRQAARRSRKHVADRGNLRAGRASKGRANVEVRLGAGVHVVRVGCGDAGGVGGAPRGAASGGGPQIPPGAPQPPRIRARACGTRRAGADPEAVALADAAPAVGTSDDGRLAVRLVSSQDEYRPGQPIRLMSELRNASSERIRVLPGFELAIAGPGGPLKPATVDIAAACAAPPEPINLDPGHVHRTIFKADEDTWPGIDTPGEYRITFRYVGPNSADGGPPVWTGKAEAPIVRVVRGK